jgi:hypothetical protein
MMERAAIMTVLPTEMPHLADASIRCRLCYTARTAIAGQR